MITLQDTRELGKSYRYIIIPAGGLTVDGVKFRGGPRAVGKKKYERLVEVGCEEIDQADYERKLQESQGLSEETPHDDAEHAGGNAVEAPAPRRHRKGRGSRVVPAGG
jgi:hypothetical protein